jgi:hypothetical protein
MKSIRTCSFPSGLRRPRGSNTMPSADFSLHGHALPQPPRLSGKPYSRVRIEISPNKGRLRFEDDASFPRHVICPRPSSTSTCAHSSGSVSWSAAHSPGAIGLYVVSVRNLAGLGVKMSSNTNPLAYRSSSQASSPRSVTSPQLPSPRTSFLLSYIWYTASS